MRKLKKMITETYKNQTPDIKARVMASIENEVQLSPLQPSKRERACILTVLRRVAFALSLCATFAVGIISGYFLIPNNDNSTPPTQIVAENYVYLDVNPSVQISLTADNIVVSCTAINDDADAILSGLNLSGVELNTALNAVVGSMYVNGYLTADENSMLISVNASSDEKTTALINYVTEKVNAVFENSDVNCSIIAQSVKQEKDLLKRAEENGVSIGKMQLIDKVIGSFDEINAENVADLSKMSINELNLMYKNKPENNEPDDDKFGVDDVISGVVQGYLDKTEAFLAVLTEISLSSSDVSEYHVKIKPSFNAEVSMVYEVFIKAGGIDYKFEVDCKTGEVNLIAEVEQPNDKPEQGGNSQLSGNHKK